MSAAWWREYRARRREEGRPVKRERRVRGDRSAEYARRRSRAAPVVELPVPTGQHGTRLAFWEDELRRDLAQEAELARLERRNPDRAVAAYRARELAWRQIIRPMEEAPHVARP
jgi:hypothetical protein